MKNAQIAVVVLFCFAAVGLTGCSWGPSSLSLRDAEALAKPDQIAPATEHKKMHLGTSSAGPDDFHWPEGKRAAINLSFDDARLSQVDCGLPILDACGVKATFYVVPSRVEQRLGGWKKAVANGHEICNHTVRHPCTGNFPWSHKKVLEEYSLEEAEHELDEAGTAIECLFGVRQTTFAYPCGQKFVGRGLSVKSYVPLVAERFIVGRGAFDEVANEPANGLWVDTVAAVGEYILEQRAGSK